MQVRRYPCKIVRVIDGDTIRLDWLLTDTLIWHDQRCRLARINTPELHDPDPAVKARAEAAKARVTALAPAGSVCLVDTAWVGDDYGRVLITIYPADGSATSINDILLAEGLADVWPLPKTTEYPRG